MERIWELVPHDTELIERLELSAKVSPVVAQLLAARGIIQPDVIRQFLAAPMGDLHDPDRLPNVGKGAKTLYDAITSGRKIVIFGDYDCDGMTGTAILVNGLRLLKADVTYYVPNRLQDGYGLNREAIESLAKRGCQLIVTVDCGVASVDEVDFANELGLDVIITDHHEFKDQLPAANAIVHPRLGDYPFHGLCGAGVAFKLIWSVFRLASGSEKVKPALRNYLVSALGLAAIGTVADMVPLLDENRIIVKHGLTSLHRSQHVGIRALLNVCKLSEKPNLGADDIGFSLGPRLNAAGRLGQAQLGVELLTTDSSERAEALAEYINNLNASRDSLERSVNLAAVKQIKEKFNADRDAGFVLDGTGWHAGVIGIVAGRIAEKHHKPTVIISWDKLGHRAGLGSARSAGGLQLHKAFEACSQHLLSHGGHAAAAGLKIDRDQIDLFREEFLEYCSSEMTAKDVLPKIRIDAEVLLPQLTLQTMDQILKIAPFGQSNPRPRFCAMEVKLSGPPKKMGGGDRHLSLAVKQNGKTLRAVAFGKGEWCDDLSAESKPIDIVFQPVINDFRGIKKVELHLLDWRTSKTSEAN